MSKKINYEALGILGAVFAAIGAAKKLKGRGSFNDDEPMLPATTEYEDSIQAMIVSQRDNPFLDQAKPFGIDHPEYTLMCSLIDYANPLADFPVTTPEFTQKITNDGNCKIDKDES